MEVFESILLGIIQGLTEFLPISSSGHLVLFQQLLNFKEGHLVFDVALHVGTVLSILTVYFSVFREYINGFYREVCQKKINHSLRLTALIVISALPAGIIGIFLKDFFENLFSNLNVVGGALILTGILLFLTKFRGKAKVENISGAIDLSIAEHITFRQALIMGLAQSIAITPGISRSGSTIAAGIFAGVERNSAATFSFIMSVPVILGAALLQLRHIKEFNESSLLLLLTGFLAAYFAGLLGLKIVLKVVKKGRMDIFSYYLWAVGVWIFLGRG